MRRGVARRGAASWVAEVGSEAGCCESGAARWGYECAVDGCSELSAVRSGVRIDPAGGPGGASSCAGGPSGVCELS